MSDRQGTESNLKGASGGLRNTVLPDHTEEDAVNWQQTPLVADPVDEDPGEWRRMPSFHGSGVVTRKQPPEIPRSDLRTALDK
ncbi:hypothetical protein T11_8837 [Trichinella zimbabwensis]|uniref:Uncharacterized protein n=1 Tax=Trichinella zimbabwensis TaxID=268475 RepID=A0A0V1HP74_9BILA|nr:hypothetical protein T11_8837 [Trichinella zimbabwensis]